MQSRSDDLSNTQHHGRRRDRKSDVLFFDDLFPQVSWSEFVEDDEETASITIPMIEKTRAATMYLTLISITSGSTI